MWFMEEPSQFSVGQTAQFLTCSIMERFRFSSIYIFANVWYSVCRRYKGHKSIHSMMIKKMLT